MMNKRKILLSCLLLVAGCQVGVSGPPLDKNAAFPTLKVEAAVVGCRVQLHMSLTNSSGSSMMLDRGALPWTESFSGIKLAIHRGNDEHELIKRIVGVDHPDGEINLRPGETTSGSITVNDTYPDLGKELVKSDLLLRWNYVLQLSTGDAKKFEKGVLRLSKCEPAA